MNDLKLVAILEHGCFPLGARNDFQIQLHGYAVRLHVQLRDQAGNGQTVRKIALFAIDVEEHGESTQQSAISIQLEYVSIN